MIHSTVVITEFHNDIVSLLFKENKLGNISVCNPDNDILSNIYIGKVKKVVKNINAAFVEIMPDLLCYLSLENLKQVFLTNRTSTTNDIKEGDEVLVQVIKEAVKTKEPVITTEISLSGKYCAVSMNQKNNGKLHFSKKLSKEYIAQLKNELSYHSNHDIIIRTNALNCKNVNEIEDEITFLNNKMQKIIDTSSYRVCYSVLHIQSPEYIKFINEIDMENIDRIVTDINPVFETLQSNYQNDLEILNKVSFYEDNYSLQKLYSIESQISDVLSKKIWLKSGGNIVIEYTEALTVIDVNTGKCNLKKDKAYTILQINMEAATEITRQLILRNISGIIVIDFINMELDEYKNQLITCLRSSIKTDKIQTDFVDITKLGLVEITRKKVRKPLYEQFSRKMGTIS